MDVSSLLYLIVLRVVYRLRDGMKTLLSERCLNYLWFLIFAIGMGIFLMVTPKYGDDYWYSQFYTSWYDEQGIEYLNDGGDVINYGIPWKDLKSTITFHMRFDNTRLGNMFGPFMLLFPKWLGSSISWIALLFSVYGTLRLAKVNIKHSWLVAVCLSMYVLTFLWHEQLGSLIFQYNYVLSGAIFIGLMLFIRYRPQRTLLLLGFIIYSLVAALWHEGFTFPFLLSLVACLVCYRSCRNKWVVIATVIMFLGLVYHVTIFNNSHRVEILGRWNRPITQLLANIYYHRAVWVAAIVSIAYICKFGIKNYFRLPVTVFSLVGIAAAIGLAFYTDTQRAAWWADVVAVILTLTLLNEWEMKKVWRKTPRMVASVCLFFITAFVLVMVDINVIRFAREYPVIVENYKKDPTKTQFSDLDDYPWAYPPFTQLLHDRYNFSSYLATFYRRKEIETDEMKVVPSSLQDIDPLKLEPVEGDFGLMKYGPYLITATDSIDQYKIGETEIDYGWYVAHNIALNCVPFVSRDGKRYVYVLPVYRRTEFVLGDVKAIRTCNKHHKYLVYPEDGVL